jgi:hypothetical protein
VGFALVTEIYSLALWFSLLFVVVFLNVFIGGLKIHVSFMLILQCIFESCPEVSRALDDVVMRLLRRATKLTIGEVVMRVRMIWMSLCIIG